MLWCLTMLMRAPILIRHPHGIATIDAEYIRSGLVASHVVVHRGRAAFIDTGANSAVPHLLGALETLGVPREAVDYVFLTHAHLDHAGGAGALMRELPAARAVLHPRAAPHLVDPAKLVAGTRAVYGDEFYQRIYGELVPLDPGRIIVTEDGQRLDLAGRTFRFLHTPGHALHHHVVVDEEGRSVFAGDTFGISYRELDTEKGEFIFPTTTPTQFDPDQLASSIDRIVAQHPEAVYLTHYGPVHSIARLAEDLKREIREYVTLVQRHADAPDRYTAISAAIRALWLARLREHGCTLPEPEIDAVVAADLDLNAQGLIAWLDRRK